MGVVFVVFLLFFVVKKRKMSLYPQITILLIVQGYADKITNKTFFLIFCFVWNRCVLLFMQFCGIYFDGIFGCCFKALKKIA